MRIPLLPLVSSPVILILLTGSLCLTRGQGRPPYVPPPAETVPGAETPLASEADGEKAVSGAPNQGETSETSLTADPAPGGPIVVSWVDFRRGTRCGFASSQDGGVTWNAPFYVGPIASGFTGDAAVGRDDAGKFYGVCQDYGSSQILFSASADGGRSWEAWRQVQSSPDKPWVGGARNGTVFVTWLGTPGGYRRSIDAGKTWEASVSLGSIYHGTSISCGNTGYLHLLFNAGSPLRYVRSRNWGATLETGRNLVADMGTFCYGCAPRQHPIVGGASDPSGKVVAAVWSSTRSGGDGNDDIWAIISRDSGNTWTNPIRVNDNAAASRQFQPWVAVDRYGRVHAVWTDLRRNGQNAIFYASATADRFGANQEITTQRGILGGFYGDYKGIAIQGEDVVMSWADSRGGDNDIYFARGMGLAGPQGTPIAAAPNGSGGPWKTTKLFDARGARIVKARPAGVGFRR